MPYFFKQWGVWKPEGEFYKDCVPADVLEKEHCEVVDLDGRIGIQRSDKPSDGAWVMSRVGKHRSGRLLEGTVWGEYPE